MDCGNSLEPKITKTALTSTLLENRGRDRGRDRIDYDHDHDHEAQGQSEPRTKRPQGAKVTGQKEFTFLSSTLNVSPEGTKK